MENKELQKKYVDKKTGIEYRLVGDYYIPNLVLPNRKSVNLGKYGRMRARYLKEHRKTEYSIMLIANTLQGHLIEIDRIRGLSPYSDFAVLPIDSYIISLGIFSRSKQFLPSITIGFFISLKNNFKSMSFISFHSVNMKHKSVFCNAFFIELQYSISSEYIFFKLSVPIGSKIFIFAPSSIKIEILSNAGASLKSSVLGLKVIHFYC